MKYQFVPEGWNIITYGDFGEEFYILLHGICGILLPNKENCSNSNKTIEEENSSSEESKSWNGSITQNSNSISASSI